MYIIMLLYRQSHIMSKLHVYCTHKDTKQYLFGLFTLYTCTMYFGERFFNSNLRDWNKIMVCILKCR